MAGREELVGTDVVVVHRLLKNRVGEDLGVPAYALYTEALVGAMGLDDPAAAGMRAYRETFDSVGEVAGWVSDLGAAWEAEQRRVRTKVTDDDALAVITIRPRSRARSSGSGRPRPPAGSAGHRA